MEIAIFCPEFMNVSAYSQRLFFVILLVGMQSSLI